MTRHSDREVPHSFVRLLFLILALAGSVSGRADESVDFSRDVRPLLSGKCFSCHGPDEDARQAELRLD